MEENQCYFCKYFNEVEKDTSYPLHVGFGRCEKLHVHEGEMYDASCKRNIPEADTDLVVCTSEWFQHLEVSINFGCNLFAPKE